MSRVEFTVLSEPVPQGSKTFVPTARGPRSKESNEGRLKPWRQAVAAAALEAMTFHGDDGTSGYEPPLTGPVELWAVFVFRRPKGHYGTGRNIDRLRPGAPDWLTGKPDLDKLVRAVGDAVTGIVVRDDSQLAIVRAWKCYGDGPALAHLRFTGIAE